MDREKLLDRIRRLLRLAESANVNEAATAAATAQTLMARHRIEAASLDTGDETSGIVDFRDAPLEASKRLRPWKIELASVVARANGCRIYLLDRGRTDEVILVGRAEDAELVRLLYGELVKRVESLTRKHGEGRDRAFCNGFRLGVVTTLEERLRKANADASERAIEAGVATDDDDPDARLAASDAAIAIRKLDARADAVDRFLDRTLGLRAGKAKSLRADAEGYAHGRIVGHTIALGRRRDD